MSLKKILAGTVAAALAVGSMAVCASAATSELAVKQDHVGVMGNKDNGAGGNFMIELINIWNKGEDNAFGDAGRGAFDITKGLGGLKITFTVEGLADDTEYDAGIVYQTAWWAYRNDLDQKTHGVNGNLGDEVLWEDIKIKGDGTYTLELQAIPQKDSDGKDVKAEDLKWNFVQIHTTIPYAEDSNVKLAVTKIEEVVAGAPAADNNGSAGGDTNQTTPDKTNADTGVEGVAVVAGLAVIAAGAVVVAKKRK